MLDLIAKNQCSEKDTQNGAADSEKLREKGGNPPTFVTSLVCGDQNDKTILNEKQFFCLSRTFILCNRQGAYEAPNLSVQLSHMSSTLDLRDSQEAG
jgi:hypothetical protein